MRKRRAFVSALAGTPADFATSANLPPTASWVCRDDGLGLDAAALASTGNMIVDSQTRVTARTRNEPLNGSQVRSETVAPPTFIGGSGRGLPRIDSANAREAFELAMSCAPPRCQRVISARP